MKIRGDLNYPAKTDQAQGSMSLANRLARGEIPPDLAKILKTPQDIQEYIESAIRNAQSADDPKNRGGDL